MATIENDFINSLIKLSNGRVTRKYAIVIESAVKPLALAMGI